MELPLQISFRDFPRSDSVATVVRERAEKLETFFDHIISCRVVLEEPHRHRHTGKLFHVRIDLKVPHGEIVVSRQPGQAESHRDIYVAIHDAFDTLQRKLQEYVQKRRRYVKQDVRPPRGKIVRILRDGDQGYGFIQTEDGREIYFHQNSVLNRHFDDLEVGSEVRYAEESGEAGPQASTVELAS